MQQVRIRLLSVLMAVLFGASLSSCGDSANPPRSSAAYKENQFFSLLQEGDSLLDRSEFGAAEEAFIEASKVYPKDPYYGSIVAEHLLELDYLSKTPELFENDGCR